MSKKSSHEIVKPYFDNPKNEELHVTSDGMVFTQKHFAEAHTSRLIDKKIESFKAADFVSKDEAKAAKEIPVNGAEEVKAKKK